MAWILPVSNASFKSRLNEIATWMIAYWVIQFDGFRTCKSSLDQQLTGRWNQLNRVKKKIRKTRSLDNLSYIQSNHKLCNTIVINSLHTNTLLCSCVCVCTFSSAHMLVYVAKFTQAIFKRSMWMGAIQSDWKNELEEKCREFNTRTTPDTCITNK